ncbi:MFS transporter [Micromonospora zhanjiangensis]|uniref:MFS transporter n=1 Tax=Micromonospora zhanjiangensis TaxID=1522057 RepID=A0ABV8KW24_9ACTN
MTTAPQVAPRAGVVTLLHRRDARLVFLAVTLCFAGSNVLVLAGGVWAAQLTGNAGAGALVSFFVAVPAVFYPLFGALTDRASQRTVMLGANLVMAAAAVQLYLVSDAGDLWLIYLATFVFGSALALMTTVESSLFVAMLPTGLLGTANGLLQSIQEGMRVLAPALGVALLVWRGGAAVATVAVAGTALACLPLWLLRPVPGNPAGGEARDVLGGLRHIRRTPDLRTTVTVGVVALLSMGLTQAALFGVVEHDLRRPVPFLGVLVAAQGVGSLLGSIAAAEIMARTGEPRFAGLALALTSLGTALLFAPALPVILAGMALQGVGLPWLLIGSLTLAQRRTPAGLQGRTSAVVSLSIFGPLALSRLAGAYLYASVGHRALLAVTTAVTASTAVLLWRRGTRRPYPTPVEV